MARVQTRKSASLAAGVYAVATEHAAARSISVSQLIEDALRAYGIPVPRGVHLDKATREYKSADGSPLRRPPPVKVPVPAPRVVGVPVSRLQLDAIAAKRRAPHAPPPGTSCANCIDAKATHRGRVDVDGPEYWLCSDCELPDDAGDGRGNWKRRTA